jgi:hypothetical protein
VTRTPTSFALALLLLFAGSGARGDVEIPRELAAVAAHLDFLADDLLEGRDTGTRGYELAALYAAAQFRQSGLAPGHGDSYFQPVPLVDVIREDSTWEVLRGERSTPLVWKEDYLDSPRASAPEVDLLAPVVFAGFGIDAPAHGRTDYAALDVRGRIVLILSGAPAEFPSEVRAHFASSRQKRIEAARRGAVGLLTLRTRDDEERSPWERGVPSAGRPSTSLRRADGTPLDASPGLRFTGSLSWAGARKLLAGADVSLDELLEPGAAGDAGARELGVALRVDARAGLRAYESPNVVALLPGSDPELRREHIVVSAHLDHVGVGAEVDGDAIYNGYYDNAMGSAILLELARRLAADPEPPRRSILFLLVTAEERGLLGSEHFAEAPTIAGGEIVANLNLDMPLFLHPLSDVVAFGAEHTTLGELARASVAAAGLTLAPDPQPEESIFVRSDQYSFVRKGIPAIYLCPGLGARDGSEAGRAAVERFRREHYHRPSDQAGLPVDWEGVRRFTSANAVLLVAIAGADERPRWLPGSFFGELFAGAQNAGATPSAE